MMRMIVVRGNHVLARPPGLEGGPIPTLHELVGCMTFITMTSVGDAHYVCADSLGDAPDGFRWLTPVALQEEAPESAELVGEALLCV